MPIDLNTLTEHDMSDDCPVCRAQNLVDVALLPAAAAWKMRSELPRACRSRCTAQRAC
jgi:hypothetical protein